MRETSKMKKTLSQILAVTGKNIVLIVIGSIVGFPTILLKTLESNPDIDVSREQITWMGSIHYFVMPLGCLLSGAVSDYFGRRKTMLLANIPLMIGWMILYYAKSATIVCFALGLMGLITGLCEAPVLTYVAEITQPHLRGMLSATAPLASIIGVFTQMLTGSFVDWRTTALINLTYPTVCIIVLLFLPESPYWLAKKNRIADAEKSMQWLRGWTQSSHVHEELEMICQRVQQSTCNFYIRRKSQWKEFKHHTFILPFILTIVAFFVSSFGGTQTVQTFAAYIFKYIHAPISTSSAIILLGVAQMLGTIFCVIIIHFTGKRLLSFISIGGTGIFYLCNAVHSYLIELNYIDIDSYSWLRMIFLIVASFWAHMGIRLVPFILVGEVFPTLIRSVATGITAAIYYLFLTIVNKTFFNTIDEMEFSGTFMFYTTVNLVGGLTLYCLLPETEGRSLKEIEDYYACCENVDRSIIL